MGALTMAVTRRQLYLHSVQPNTWKPIRKPETLKVLPWISMTQPCCTTYAHPFCTSHNRSGILEDKETKTLTVWSNVRQLKASPLPALVLGVAGLMPFISAPTYMIFQGLYCSNAAFAQAAYGAVILSFLGGVRWGFTLPEENPVQPDWVNLGYSVLPSLIAWSGLLLPNPVSLFTVMGGLTLVGYMDMAMYGYPAWFKGLRFLLSFVAVLALWTTFMCSLLLRTDKKGQNPNMRE